MSGEIIDEYYAVFTAQSAPFLEGCEIMGTATEGLATTVTTASTTIMADTEKAAMAVRAQSASIEESALADQVAFDRMAASAMAMSAGMERAAARAAASNEAITASITKGEAAQAEASAASGKRLALGAAGLALIAAGTVKMAADFQTSTTTLVTTAGETESGLATVRQGMLEMTGQVGDSAAQLSKAMYTVESGGQHGADGLTVLRAAAEGAKTENAELGVVADAVTSVLQDYHLKAGDAATITSKLVAAVGSGKTNFQDFAGALHSVLPIASSAHISLDDISGSMAAMTVHGMSAAQAAENMADTIKHMLAPTQVQTKELGQLGMSSSQLADMLSSKGLSGTLQSLSQTIMDHMGPSGRVMLNAFNQSKDAARDASIMMESMPKGVMAIASAYREGSISLGDWRKDLKALPTDQANLLTQFKSMQDRASGFNDVLKSGSPAAQTYQDALRRVTGDATGMNTALMLTGENTDYVNGAVKKVSGATAEAGNHVKGWHDVQKNFNQKMAEAKDGLGAMAIEVGQNLLPVVTVFFGWLADGAQWLGKHKTLATILAATLGVLTVAFTIAAVAVWIMNSAFLANPITWIILAIVAAIALVTFGIYELVKHWGAIWKWVKDIALDVWHWLVKVWDDIVKAVKKFWQHDIIDPIKEAWDKVNKWTAEAISWFESIPGKVEKALKELPGKLEHAAKEGMHKLMFAVGYGIGTFLKTMHDLPGKVWHEVTVLWDGFNKLVAEGIAKAKKFFSDMGDDIISTAKKWWKDLNKEVADGIDATEKFFHDLPIKLKAEAEEMWHSVSSKAKSMCDDVVGFVKSLPGKAKDAVSELPGKIKDAVSDAGTWLWDAGKHIVEGAIGGFKAKAKEMLDTVKGWGHDILNGFNAAVGNHSPSRLFAIAGGFIVAGLVKGIRDSGPDAVDAMDDLAGQLTLAPQVASGIGVDATGGYAPIIPKQWRPPPPPGAGGGYDRDIRIEVPVMLDSKEVYRAVVPHAQNHKERNGSTQLT